MGKAKIAAKDEWMKQTTDTDPMLAWCGEFLVLGSFVWNLSWMEKKYFSKSSWWTSYSSLSCLFGRAINATINESWIFVREEARVILCLSSSFRPRWSYPKIPLSKFNFIAKWWDIHLGEISFYPCRQFYVVSELVKEWGRQRTSSSSSADESTCLSPSLPLHLSLLSMAYALSNDVPSPSLCKLCPS